MDDSDDVVMCVLNKSKIGINVKDILENENNANLGERAKAQTDSNPLVDFTADDDSGDETVKEKGKSDDDNNVTDTTFDEAEDSSDDDAL